jgi:hypothetical protein
MLVLSNECRNIYSTIFFAIFIIMLNKNYIKILSTKLFLADITLINHLLCLDKKLFNKNYKLKLQRKRNCGCEIA